MTMPSLESAFQRLALRPSSLCRNCTRSLATSARASQQRSATASMAEMLENNQTTDASQPRSARVLSATAPPGPASTPTTPAARTSAAYAMAKTAVRQATSPRIERERQQAIRDMERTFSRRDLEQQMGRRWKAGDVYAPHDLTGVEMGKWKRLNKAPRPKYDVMDQLGINPLHHYKNVSIMSEYMSEMGRIKAGAATGLRPKNQRRMAKAIRRAIGIGLMPGVHRHPEIMRLEMEEQEGRR